MLYILLCLVMANLVHSSSIYIDTLLQLVGWLEIIDGVGGIYAAYRYSTTTPSDAKMGISIRGFVLFM